MGNYERTLSRIAEIEEHLSQLKDELLLVSDGELRDKYLEAIAYLEQEKSEKEGYLEELAYLDGYDSYSEMCESCIDCF